MTGSAVRPQWGTYWLTPRSSSRPVIGQRPVHGLDNVAPLAKRFQGRLGLAGDNPAFRLRLGGEAVVFQTLRPADHKVPVLADEVGASFSRPQIDDALISLLGNQHLVEPGQPLSVHLIGELAGELRSHFDAPIPA